MVFLLFSDGYRSIDGDWKAYLIKQVKGYLGTRLLGNKKKSYRSRTDERFTFISSQGGSMQDRMMDAAYYSNSLAVKFKIPIT